MARLHRPYIPIAIRVEVAERQYNDRFGSFGSARGPRSKLVWLKYILAFLFPSGRYALDHNPALVNRKMHTGKAGIWYTPSANDPDFLIYREAGPGSDHDIKTRVRGDGAQLSDLAIARKRKRREKKLVARRAKQPKPKIRGKRQPWARRKFKWPSRPFNRRHK